MVCGGNWCTFPKLVPGHNPLVSCGKSITVQLNNKAVRDEVYRNRVPKEIQQGEQGPEWPCLTACRRAHRRRRAG